MDYPHHDSTLANLEKKESGWPEHGSSRIPPSLNLNLTRDGLQLVALIDPIVPIFNGLLGLFIHMYAL